MQTYTKHTTVILL